MAFPQSAIIQLARIGIMYEKGKGKQKERAVLATPALQSLDYCMFLISNVESYCVKKYCFPNTVYTFLYAY